MPKSKTAAAANFWRRLADQMTVAYSTPKNFWEIFGIQQGIAALQALTLTSGLTKQEKADLLAGIAILQKILLDFTS